MPAKTTCPNCQLSIRVPVDYAGRTVKCPQCSQRFAVPGAAPITIPKAPSFDDLVLKTLDDETPAIAAPTSPSVAKTLPGPAQYWKCPHCTALWEKKPLLPAQLEASHIRATVRCETCGHAYGYNDVHGGKYDAVEVEVPCGHCGTLFTGPADILLGQPCPACHAILPTA